MNRARFAIIAALAAATAAGSTLLAQNPAPKAPEFKSILANRKVEPPIKGQAEVDYVQPSTKRNGDVVVTTIRVKNTSPGPIARLTVAETWFDKNGAIVGGGQGYLEKILEPGGIETITIQTQWNAKMNGNGYNFTHANGTVKPRRVPKIDDAKAPAAAAGTKAPAKK
jgi:hypothetical protein